MTVLPCTQLLTGQPLSKPCSTGDCSPRNSSPLQPRARRLSLCKSQRIYVTPHTQPVSGVR